jgi:activator of HSP90 ATPase
MRDWESKSLSKDAAADLRQRLLSIELKGGATVVRIVEVLKMTVDASLHVRRGKRMATFDITFTARWEGWAAGPGGRPSSTPSGKQAAGECSVVDVMQDDVASDFSVPVYMSSISGNNAVDVRAKATAVAGLPIAIRAQLRAFATALATFAVEADAADAVKKAADAAATAVVRANPVAEAERARLLVEQTEKMRITADAISTAVIAAAAAAAPPAKVAPAAPTGPQAFSLPVPLKSEAAGAAPETNASVWNAGGWAWETRDRSVWAHTKLLEVLSNLELDVPPVRHEGTGRVLQPGAFLRLALPSNLKVDASVCLRKGRRMVLFELNAEIPWEGNFVGGEGAGMAAGDGVIRIVELDQEQLEEDGAGGGILAGVPEEEAEESDSILARVLQTHGVPMIRARIKAFAKELLETAEFETN